MDRRAYFERLDSTADEPSGLFEHFERRTTDGWTYHTLPEARHGLERGTVVVDDADAVVRGFPSIPRVLVLDPGIPRFFEEGATVAVEEKLNGFNVRVVDVGEVLAFTRSGYLCPYTTARARERLALDDFFADHPDEMLCAELVGPETPYTTHDYDDVDSHAFRVFGIRDRESGDPLPVTERRDRCAEYGFSQPRCFGRYDPTEAVEGVADAIAELDADEREGVVVTSADATEQVKYTTESQNHAELAYAFSLPFERGRDFLFSRVVREAFQSAEFDESEDRRRERAHALGEAILESMVDTIEAVRDGESIGERHTVRGDPGDVDALFDHLADHGLSLKVERDRCEDGERVVEFVKLADSTRDRVKYYLDGGTRDE